MGFWCFFSFGFYCSAVLNAGDGPVEVGYNPGDTLRVELHFAHVPDGYDHYDVKTQHSDGFVSSGYSNNRNKQFSVALTNLDNHAVLEIHLQRPDGKNELVQNLIKLKELNSLTIWTRPRIFRKITIDWRPAASTGIEIFTALKMQSKPRPVYFKEGDVLRFILKFMNLPNHDSFDGDIYLRNGSSANRLVENELRLNEQMNGSHLILQMYFITQEYNITDTLTIIRLIYDENRHDDSSCLGTPCEIVLDWESRYLSDTEPIAAAVIAELPAPPRVTPERFSDADRHFAVFTCHSKGSHRDLLSWYQMKGKNSSQLLMKQFSRDWNTKEMKLVLNKTLTTYDSDSWIYCTWRSDGGSASRFSNYVQINSSRVLPEENVYITVRPASEVANFYVNTTQSFECGGSRPVDGRSFNWYIEEVPSSNNFSHAPAEKMISNGNTRNVNLTLDLNETYDLKRIYCVQEYHMNIQSRNGYYYWRYGEIARSNEILLSMVSEDPDNMKYGSDDAFPTFVIYIFLGVVAAILATVTSLVILRRYRRINRSQNNNNNESLYATAEITYAELQLSPESNNIVRREEATPYAEIIGSCRPKA